MQGIKVIRAKNLDEMNQLIAEWAEANPGLKITGHNLVPLVRDPGPILISIAYQGDSKSVVESKDKNKEKTEARVLALRNRKLEVSSEVANKLTEISGSRRRTKLEPISYIGGAKRPSANQPGIGRARVIQAIREADYDLFKAADSLGILRRELHLLMMRYRIDVADLKELGSRSPDTK